MDIATLDRDVVVIENTSAEDETYAFDNKLWVVRARSRAVVPIGLARLYFGHWEITDPVARKEELSRLQTKHGVEAFLGPNKIPPMNVVVKTLDGEKIVTVLDDPHGASLPKVIEGADEVERLRSELEALRSQFDKAMSKLGSGSANLEDIPVDSGTPGKPNGKKAGNGGSKTIEAAPPEEELPV